MPNTVQLLVGLGNPGPQYATTRHNVGFWFVDALAQANGVALRNTPRFFGELGEWPHPGGRVRLFKPSTFMNRSGQAVAALANYYRYPPASILVVHDDVDLPAGAARLKDGGGHGGHNGLRDILQHLDGDEFLRLRFGVGHPGHKDQVADHVLQRAAKKEEEQILAAMGRANDVLSQVLAGELRSAMNALHRPTAESDTSESKD